MPSMRRAVFRQPGIDVERLGMGMIKTGPKQALQITFATIGAQDWRTGVETRKAPEQPGLGRPVEIQFSQHNSVGDGDPLL